MEKVSPSGSYPKLGNWMSERGKSKLVAPDGELETYFDNIGRYHYTFPEFDDVMFMYI